MNYLIQRGKVRGQVINVPEGLPEILSDITREVLRCQPTTECLCQFIIDYLHSVIVTREKAMLAKTIIDRALRTVDEIISDMCVCDISVEKNAEIAYLMEECFKRFLEKRRCEEHREKEIVKFLEEDVLDELILKCRFTDQELKLSRPMIEAAYNRFVEVYVRAQEGTKGTEALYQYFKERELKRKEDERRNKAAIRIQACFRGYLVRLKMLRNAVPVHLDKREDTSQSDEVDEEIDRAARTIQKFFRSRSRTSQMIQDNDQVCHPASSVSMGIRIVEDEAPEEVEDKNVPVKPIIEIVPPKATITHSATEVAPEPEPEKPEEVPPEPEAEPPAPTADVEANADDGNQAPAENPEEAPEHNE